MSQARINSNLEALFLEEHRWQGITPRVVFWNDTEQEFRDAYEQISLAGVPHLQKWELTSFNAWHTKIKLHQSGPEDCILLYQEGPEPPQREDWLLDARHYGQRFSAHRSEMLFQELGFTHPKMRLFVHAHAAFFNAQERLKKLQALQPAQDIEPETLSHYMMAALINLKHPDPSGIVLQVLQQGLDPENNSAWQSLCKYFAPEAFFELCQQTLNLPQPPANLRQVFLQAAVTHFGHQYQSNLPAQWQSLQATPSNACFRFVDQWIHDDRVRAQWFAQAEEIAETLQVAQQLTQNTPDDYVHCETFEAVDAALLQRVQQTLLNTRDMESLTRCEQWLNQRQPLLKAPKWIPFYNALGSAVQLCLQAEQASEVYRQCETLSALFEHYTQSAYRVDQAYRHYWQAAQALSDAPLLQALSPTIEQVYRDTLHQQNARWDTALHAAGSWPAPALDRPLQTDFFQDQVWRKSNNGELRTVVIISDAMRYEVAQELHTRLQAQLPGQSELEAMVGVLPSRTHFGMAALLPRPTGHPLQLTPELRVHIDQQYPENADSRHKLLSEAGQVRGGKPLAAYRYAEVNTLNREAGRELSKAFQVAYVYHDQIDATGDKPANEAQVFKACQNTVDELFTLIKRLVHWNVSQILVTADHGFLYQQQPLGDPDKIPLPEQTLLSKRRCAIATVPSETPGVLCLQLTHYQHGHETLYALVPRGGQRFRKQGGSNKYAHGGVSLQEICVPVLTYHHVKSTLDKIRPKTGIRVLATQRRITNNVFSLPLLQEQAVDSQYRGRQVRLFFESEEGQPLSNSKTVVFDSSAPEAPEREQRVALTLNANVTQKHARLRMIDDEDQSDVIAPETWEIQISFSNEFGF